MTARTIPENNVRVLVAAAVGEVAMDGVAVGGSEGEGVKGGEWAVATSDRWAAAL